jgi:hypothetical protein
LDLEARPQRPMGINSGPSKRMQDAHNVRFAEDIFHPA